MRLIDADALKTWFGEKDLYTYDYIVGTINDAPTIKPEAKLLAEVKLPKEELQELVGEVEKKIRAEMAHPEPHWIPCSERLPETDETVLVTCRTKKGANNVNRAYCDKEGFWHGSGSMSNVVAWMPLPEPWRE